MEKMNFNLVDVMNTYNHALMLIKAKEYKMFFYPDEREEFFGDFYALKEDKTFSASDPLRLLGIITIWENYGNEWRHQTKLKYEDLYDEILTKALPDKLEDIEKLTEKEFKKITSEYKIFFNKLNIDFNHKETTRKEFYDLLNTFYIK